MRSDQEIFNIVAHHLLSQRVKALRNGRCVYHGPDGTQCAVGCLIPNELYEEWMEGHDVSYQRLADGEYSIVVAAHCEVRQLSLLRILQGVHDNNEPIYWRGALKHVAKSFNLEWQFE